MAWVGIIAADLAALRAILPLIPNPGLVVMILVLEVGLFRMVSHQGAARAFWFGFEVAGWAYVVACSVFAKAGWQLARSLFDGYVLKRPIGAPLDINRFLLFAGALQLTISLAITLFVGFLTRSLWRRIVVNGGPESLGGRPAPSWGSSGH